MLEQWGQAGIPDLTPAHLYSLVLTDVGGHIAHVRVVKGSSTTWQLWLSNQSNDQQRLVYEGNRSITSTTVNLAGDTLFFTVQTEVGSSNYDVYRLTLSNNAVARITTTSTAEADVSVSASGRTLVWSGINSSTSKRAVYVRTYSSTDTSFSQKVLSISSGNQSEPTVSGDGAYVAFVRQASSTQVMRFRKSDSTYLTVSTPSTGVYVRSPSVSNGGLKVAWSEEPKSTQASTVKVKTISGGSILTAVNSSSRIKQPQLTSDGAYLSYAITYNGTFNVSTKNLSSGQIARLTADTSSSINNVEAFWQKGAYSAPPPPPTTIEGTVTSGFPVRIKLFQASTGALVSEVQADSSGRYSFSNIASVRYYVTAYEDGNGNGSQDSTERAGAFGRAAIPQQIDATSGTYTANITLTTPTEIESNDDLSTDNLLLQTTALNGFIEFGDHDYFRLLVPAAGTYNLRTTGSCSYSGDPDTYLMLYDSSGNNLASNDDYGDYYCSSIAYNFAQAGTYFVRVSDLRDNNTGDYNLSFR